MRTPRMAESKRLTLARDTAEILNAGKMEDVAALFEGAALHIGQYGWWKPSWGPNSGPEAPCACIWIALDSALEEFGRNNDSLDMQARRYVEAAMLNHFGLDSMTELFNLNDRQPDHEGQGWAIYHLNTLAQQIRVRHRLHIDAQATRPAARN